MSRGLSTASKAVDAVLKTQTYPVSLGDFCLAHAEAAQWEIPDSPAFDSTKIAAEGFSQALWLLLTNYIQKIQHSVEPSAYLRPWISLVNSMVYLVEWAARGTQEGGTQVLEGLLGLHQKLQGVLYLEDQPEVRLASCFLLDHMKVRMDQLPSESLEVQAILVVLRYGQILTYTLTLSRNIIEGYPLVWLPNTDAIRTHAAVVGSPPFRSYSRLLTHLPRSSWVGTISLFKEFHYLSAVCQLQGVPTLVADSERLEVVTYRLADLSSATGVDLAGPPDFQSARYSDMEELLVMIRLALRRLGCEAFAPFSLLNFEESSDRCSGGDMSRPSAEAEAISMTEDSESNVVSASAEATSLESISPTEGDSQSSVLSLPSAEAMSHESISPTEEDSQSHVLSLPSAEAMSHESISPTEEDSESDVSAEDESISPIEEDSESESKEGSSNEESDEGSSNEDSEVDSVDSSEESSEVVVRKLPKCTAKMAVVHATDGATAGRTIKRIASRQSGVKGVTWDGTYSTWRVTSKRRRYGTFPIAQYGDEEAFRLAIELNKRVATRTAPATRQSGHIGVNWRESKSAWMACWHENGIQKTKTFYPAQYGGDEQAKQAAIELRKKKVAEVYLVMGGSDP